MLDMLHVIYTRLRQGHFSIHVGDGSQRNEETVKNLELRLWMWLLLYYYYYYYYLLAIGHTGHFVKKLCLRILLSSYNSRIQTSVVESWLFVQACLTFHSGSLLCDGCSPVCCLGTCWGWGWYPAAEQRLDISCYCLMREEGGGGGGANNNKTDD